MRSGRKTELLGKKRSKHVISVQKSTYLLTTRKGNSILASYCTFWCSKYISELCMLDALEVLLGSCQTRFFFFFCRQKAREKLHITRYEYLGF